MLNILILCTGNSCRSILAEALINHLASERFRAFSAGSHPTGKVNENALTTIKRKGLSTDAYTSKSWNELEGQKIDIAITVCDQAAGEVCPIYLNNVIKAHWGLPDPAHVNGTHEIIDAAFEKTYEALERRIQQMLALPIENMSNTEITNALNKIGETNL